MAIENSAVVSKRREWVRQLKNPERFRKGESGFSMAIGNSTCKARREVGSSIRLKNRKLFRKMAIDESEVVLALRLQDLKKLPNGE